MTLRDHARRFMPASGSLGAIVIAVLIPKCPMCIAAALSALGLGATLSASLAPIARPATFLFAALADRRIHGDRAPAAPGLLPEGWITVPRGPAQLGHRSPHFSGIFIESWLVRHVLTCRP